MNARLRVLMTADAVGGVWTYATDVAVGLEGADVTLAIFGPAPSEAQRRQAVGVELVETGLPLDWTAAHPDDVLWAATQLRGLVRELQPDIVHLNAPALAAGAGTGAPTLGVCHSCVTTWWAAVRDGPMPEDFRWRTDLMRQGMAACDLLAAPSRSFAEALARAYGGAPPMVVRNGRRSAPPRKREREPIVLTAGRLWDEGKNAVVLDAAAALTKSPVFAAGPLAAPGGASEVWFRCATPLGALSAAEMAEWMSRSAVFASAALYEPFGLGVLEAAQAGCALVLSDIPSFRELWSGAAVFVDPRDAAGFARAFDILTGDCAEATRMGVLARRRAARFNAGSMCAATLGLYQRLSARRVAA